MSTYMQLIVELTTGDDLVLDALRRGDKVQIATGMSARWEDPAFVDDIVEATVHSVAYIPEEALE